ncbi:hypothetical protein ACQPX6_02190 [Actinomycetospora sp. CA-101289]|uniref:hypothetical protein n=1 Tax=Actinomycetospora sp. CA-101289 TaxID=3239893 RepID=UPI003D9589D2
MDRRRVGQWWRERFGAGRAAAREVAREAERVVARVAARDRLRAVEAEIARLLADPDVPARGRRLAALGLARDDLEAELAAPGDVPVRRSARGVAQG